MKLATGAYDLVYVAPERFRSRRFREAVGNTEIQLLAIDEAHLLDRLETLDTLRLLLNFQSQGEYDLSLLLIGQPRVIPSIQRLRGLDERMNVKCLLRPLNAEESAGYVRHRMNLAGAEHEIFDETALDEVFRQTLGVPGRINRLCDLALLIGFAEGHHCLSVTQIAEVAKELMSVGESSAA